MDRGLGFEVILAGLVDLNGQTSGVFREYRFEGVEDFFEAHSFSDAAPRIRLVVRSCTNSTIFTFC